MFRRCVVDVFFWVQPFFFSCLLAGGKKIWKNTKNQTMKWLEEKKNDEQYFLPAFFVLPPDQTTLLLIGIFERKLPSGTRAPLLVGVSRS